MQRLNLPVQPVFYVLIAGKQSGMLVSGILEQFKGEIFSKAPLSVFEESDVVAGVLTTCRNLAVAPRAALAPRAAPAAGQQRLASSGKQLLCPALTAAGNKAVRKYWTRIQTNINAKLHLLAFNAAPCVSGMLSNTLCVCRQLRVYVCACPQGQQA